MRYAMGLVMAASLLLASPVAHAWELRVCAQPANPPVSSEDASGFENRIAAVLADELGAELTFEWLVLNRQTVAYEMNAGACDVAMGVADGAGGLISTIAYYQTPYVWVFPADGPELTGALDDAQLEGLRLATYPNGLTDNAVRSYGWGDQLVHVEPTPRNLGHDYTEPILEALLAGEIDAALLEGPRAGNFVLQNPELALAPVSPLIVEPLMQLYRNATIATRAGDEALRDQLNVALASRWDDVQAVLAEFGVPTMPAPAPALPRRPAADAQVGLLLPTAALPAAETDAAAQAARDGARLGHDLSAATEQLDIRLLQASTPNPAAARRAAERLIELDGVRIIIGGIGLGQAEQLAAVANEHATPFLSLDSPGDDAGTFVFSIAPSLPTMLSALLESAGPRNWHVVTEAGEAATVVAEVAAAGGQVDGVTEIAGPTLIYYDLLAQLTDSNADAVLLNLPNAEQEQFIAQAAMFLPEEMEVHGVTDLVGQSRDFLLRWRSVAAGTEAQPRLAVWEPTIPSGLDLSHRFSGRTGKPFDPAAWAGYAALTIAHQAILTGEADLATQLASGMRFQLGKEQPAWFDPDTHELLQDLYLVRISDDAQWSLSVTDQLELAEAVRTLPAGE